MLQWLVFQHTNITLLDNNDQHTNVILLTCLIKMIWQYPIYYIEVLLWYLNQLNNQVQLQSFLLGSLFTLSSFGLTSWLPYSFVITCSITSKIFDTWVYLLKISYHSLMIDCRILVYFCFSSRSFPVACRWYELVTNSFETVIQQHFEYVSPFYGFKSWGEGLLSFSFSQCSSLSYNLLQSS